jgi:hypothetical protein
MKLRIAAAAAAVGLLASGLAHAEGLKLFKDWSAACDNAATCAAYGFQGDEFDIGYLKLSRDAGEAPTTLSMLVSAGDSDGGPLGDATWTVLVDGRPVAGFATVAGRDDGAGYWRTDLKGAQAHAFIDAIRNGDELSVHTPDGLRVARYSLAGLSATLLWFDETQDRIGTGSALLRRGTKPTPATPAAPVVTRGPETPQAGLPKTLPRSIAARPEIRACEVEYATADDLEVHRLSPGVLLWQVPCWRGAYNTIYALLLSDEDGGQIRHAVFPDKPGAGQDQSGELMNAAYDPKTRTLSNFDKARGIGDCGAQSEWVWTGSAFRLTWQAIMPECRGVPFSEWPSTWTATVK